MFFFFFLFLFCLVRIFLALPLKKDIAARVKKTESVGTKSWRKYMRTRLVIRMKALSKGKFEQNKVKMQIRTEKLDDNTILKLFEMYRFGCKFVSIN